MQWVHGNSQLGCVLPQGVHFCGPHHVSQSPLSQAAGLGEKKAIHIATCVMVLCLDCDVIILTMV